PKIDNPVTSVVVIDQGFSTNRNGFRNFLKSRAEIKVKNCTLFLLCQPGSQLLTTMKKRRRLKNRSKTLPLLSHLTSRYESFVKFSSKIFLIEMNP
ncbi:hypothetical protein L9F63_001407, partial [Diploptera punctata]